MASTPITCPECDAYRNAHGNTGLRAAAASVGMSHGLSAQEAIDLLFAQYHANGHRFGKGTDELQPSAPAHKPRQNRP